LRKFFQRFVWDAFVHAAIPLATEFPKFTGINSMVVQALREAVAPSRMWVTRFQTHETP